MDELLKDVAGFIRKGSTLDALKVVVCRAPDDVKEKAKRLFENPNAIRSLDEWWVDLLSLIYYAHISRQSQPVTRLGIAARAVSSLTAAKLSRKLNIPELEAIFLLSGAKALILMEMRDRAEICYLKAEEILRDLVKRDESFLRELADVLNNLGIIYLEMNERERCERYLKEALEIGKRLTDESILPILAQTLNNLALLYKEMERYDDAVKFFDEAERIYRKLVERDEIYAVELAVVLCNYSVLCKVIGKYEKAESLYKEALTIFKKLTEKDILYGSGVIDVLISLVRLYYRDMKRYDEAERYMRTINQEIKELIARMLELPRA